MGHLSVLDVKPLPPAPRIVSLFEIFAARAAAEHRRLKAEEAVRAKEEQLSQLLQNALDGILVLNGELEILQVNPAAERLFGCTQEDLAGERIVSFLAPESAAKVQAFAVEISARPAGRQQLWVPQDLVARRWDHSLFAAEATLSRFESRKQVFFTLILRNADERGEAERQIQLLTQEAEYLREAVRDLPGQGALLGRSDGMLAVVEAIKKVAVTDSTVLITGETGTGKELVARSLHRASRRADKPLVLVNCAAIPANLIESELFGHERGAFTGAVSRREGRFALANHGTIFLDEIGELPLELQAKLLRVLQEGEFEPLGSTKTVQVDVRVVAATHRDLKAMTRQGTFREDLYFRLHVFPIHIPPLRERARDVEILAAEFVARFSRRMGKRLQPLTDQHFQALRSYEWPGNVRELQNVIERAVILASDGQLQLERAMCGFAGLSAPPPKLGSSAEPARILTVRELEELERANIVRALSASAWRVAGEQGAARLLGIPPTTLASRMKALAIRRPSSAESR
jgi:PAS domain S-box-containing protein